MQQVVSGVSSTYAVWTKGTGRVVISIYERAGGGLKYFAPHEDEQTSISAAKEVINRHGGRLVELVHGGTRDIKFSIGTTEYMFDPNRMFYDVAAKESLEDQGRPSSPSAVVAVRELASLCLAAMKIADPGLLIGAHNNSDGAFSILSYRDDPKWKVFAERVNVDPSQDIDNFFFVTESGDYEDLVGEHYNAVLAKARPPQDNGTLGVYCAFQGIPYANCEAQRENLNFQIKMYEELHPRTSPHVA